MPWVASPAFVPLITLMLIGGCVRVTFFVPPAGTRTSSTVFAGLTVLGLFASQVPAYTAYFASPVNGNTVFGDFMVGVYVPSVLGEGIALKVGIEVIPLLKATNESPSLAADSVLNSASSMPALSKR